MGAFFVDLANFGRSQTASLVSRPKFAKNYKTSTAITSIVICYCKLFCHIERSEISPSLRDLPKANRGNPKKIIRATAPNLARFVVQKIGRKDAVVRPPIFC
ncbi:hypothetical protein [Helicobacter sp. 23-1045]